MYSLHCINEFKGCRIYFRTWRKETVRNTKKPTGYKEVAEEAAKHDFLSMSFEEGEMDGYLGDDLPNPLIILPPPPDEGSTAWELDHKLSIAYLQMDEARKELARRDAILRFPFAADAFNHALNGIIHHETTPALYTILARTRLDGGSSTGSAKRYYRRPRPFMVNHFPTLTPWEEDVLREDGSYPSGHTAIGWIWALILTDLFPSRSTEILERGLQFGISRNVCNVHWHSDVVAGRKCGGAVFKRLQQCPEFLRDLTAARKELGQEGLRQKVSAA